MTTAATRARTKASNSGVAPVTHPGPPIGGPEEATSLQPFEAIGVRLRSWYNP